MDFKRMLAYTDALSKNNNRQWFHDNHGEYDDAKDDFLALLDIMKLVIAQEAPEIGDSLLFENSKNFMYRIPRDMRYSKAKEPYNPAFRAYFSPKKKNFLPLSYYLHISYEGCYLEGGAYPWEPKDLNRLRSFIATNYEELESIIDENGLVIFGEKLKRVPNGFDAEHPAAEWLKYKFYLVEYDFSTEDLAGFNAFADAAAKAIHRFEPLRKFFSAAFVYTEE
ncbi:MAG: DUF2461 domain-containing protein [Oscillospiraceae bacterium]|nr:DUF2461 domain-containing protein [Oscillospiraceae bacterium]